MAQYPVYVNWNGLGGCPCFDVPIDATVGQFLKDILNTDRVVNFNELTLNTLVNEMSLADIGLGAEATVSVDPFISIDSYNAKWFNAMRNVASCLHNADWYNLYTNPNFTAKLVLDNLDFSWDAVKISQHKTVYMLYDSDIIATRDINIWGALSVNQHISVEFIRRHKDKEFDWKELINRRDFSEFFDIVPLKKKWQLVSKKINLPLDLVVKQPYMAWDYKEICKYNRNWTTEYVERLSGMPLCWDWISKFITSEELLERYIDRNLNWNAISKADFITIDIIRKYKEKEWDITILYNKNIDLTIHFVEMFKICKNKVKKICWKKLTRKIPKITLEFLIAHKEFPWSWRMMSERSDINMQIVNHFIKERWDWRALTENIAISMEEKKEIYIDSRVWKWKWPTTASVIPRLVPTIVDYRNMRFEDICNIADDSRRTSAIIDRIINRMHLSDLYMMTAFDQSFQKEVLGIALDKGHHLNLTKINIELLLEIYEKYHMLRWPPATLSSHPNLPFEYIIANHDVLGFQYLCLNNSNIEKIVEYFPHKIQWDAVAANRYFSLDFLRKHYGRAINTKMHLVYANFENTEEFVREFPVTRANCEIDKLICNYNLTIATINSLKGLLTQHNFSALLNCNYEYEKKLLCNYEAPQIFNINQISHLAAD